MDLLHIPGSTFNPLVFNVESSVGFNGQNSNGEDKVLVQFLLRRCADSPKLNPARRARMKIRVDGMVGPATIDAIKAAQEHMRERNPNTVVDGRVSRARGVTYATEAAWTIVTLNNVVRHNFPGQWPRLQDIAECPGQVRSKVPNLL